MISMNCSPPRPIDDIRLAMLPAVKARMRNRSMWNIGSATRVSITTKASSSSTPTISSVSTAGLVHPIVWPP